MSTPLFTALEQFAAENPLRMAMPGHKGMPIPGLPEDFARLDFTELPPTGNLYGAGGDVVEQAELEWAKAWGADSCLFLTGGATQGVHTMLALSDSETVLVDRVSHRSVHTGLALLGQTPIWLPRPWLADAGVAGPLQPEQVEAALAAHPACKAVCVTSPTYYGVCSDLAALAAVCHRHGAKLLVDGAHGAHLFLLGGNPYRDADLVTVSAHKTLPAPGQSALFFGKGISMAALRQASLLFATSSPSYPMMAALDALRPWLLNQGKNRYLWTGFAVAALRRNYPVLTEQDARLDPTRLTLCVENGYQVERQLQEQNIWPEMADSGHVVFILTCADQGEEVLRLEEGLAAIGLRGTSRPSSPVTAPPLPRQICSPREALFAPKETISLAQAVGRVAAEQIAPYPPGVPIVAPGEEISQKVLAYLEQLGYNEGKTTVLRQK